MSKIGSKDWRFFDFMCSCGEEKEKRCEAVYDEVMAAFREEYANMPGRFKRDVTDRDFVDLVVGNLWHGLDRGQADITGIYTDMWSGIAVKYQYGYKEELECEDENEQQTSACKCESDPNYDCQWKTQSFWVECDRIHHGLARVYQLVRDFDATL